jgi:phosphoribosylformimino-5-aminoimidazole carboxamide ribotide isomerase
VSTQRASTFTLFPAIDLRGGRVVRLRQGDFAQESEYSTDPAAVAAGFAEAGADWIHVVDLDGALHGERRQASTLAAMVARLGPGRAKLQVAGGFRTEDAIEAALGRGAERVVIGTAALADPAFVGAAIERHGTDRIAVALDVRDGIAVGQGWIPGARGVAVDLALERLARVGVTTFAVTAIDRDGLLGGPDLALLERMTRATDAAIVASGGIASVDDLSAVRRIGCSGAIVGRALYDGTLDLGILLEAAARQNEATPEQPGGPGRLGRPG